MIVTIDDYWLTFIVATLLPAAVALINQRWATGAMKALTLLFLSVISGFLTALAAVPDHSFDLKSSVVSVVVTFVTAVATHYGLLGTNGLGITGRDGAIARALPGGIGPSAKPE